MLVPVAQQQLRFFAPGLSADPSGIAFGRSALAVLPSLDRVVLVLRSLTRESDLEELYRDLEVIRARSALGSTEFFVSFPAVDSRLLDRVSTLASLHGGELLTGDGRHMVRYRDRRSPLGYDIERVVESDGDLLLYGRLNEGSYEVRERVTLRQLILRVVSEPLRAGRAARGPALLLAAPGLRVGIETLLLRAGVDAQVARIEGGQARLAGGSSGRSTGIEAVLEDAGGFLYRAESMPERLMALLSRSLGVKVFIPEGEDAAVEVGFSHPFDLLSCSAALRPFGLHLFQGGCSGALVVELDGPSFSPLLSKAACDEAALPRRVRAGPNDGGISLAPRLCREPSRASEIRGVMVPRRSEALLLRLLHFFPRETVESLSVIGLEAGILLVSGSTIDEVPLGTPLVSFGPRILLPAGWGLRPRVAADRAGELLGIDEESLVVFFSAEEPPISILESSMEPLDAAVMSRIAAGHARDRDLPSPPKVSRVTFDQQTGFPLWGGRKGARRLLTEPSEDG